MLSNASCAYIFPGQGSQAVGMGRELQGSEPFARAMWGEADSLLGFELSKIALEGPESELQRTENTQPALLVASLAELRAHTERGTLPPASFLAGHSLGEYTALVVAGSLSFADAVKLVRKRGELMAAEGERVEGAMSAVIGLDTDALSEICANAGIDIANFNSPEQTVISGAADRVRKAGEEARAAGARRVIPLNVSGAFHSRLMRPAAESFRATLAEVAFSSPGVQVISNVSAQPLRSQEEIGAELVEQLYSPVRWYQTLQFMWEQGVRDYYEIGPGRVLTGLVRRTLPEATAVCSENLKAEVR